MTIHTAARRDDEPFDFIIVGAGTSGCALAGRLSENGRRRVLLLEAGERDSRMDIRIPAAFAKLFRSSVDWNYDTVPQPGLGNRTIYWPRGKVLGGSSSINAMMWVRGFAEDFDDWARHAGPGWSWEALLPHLHKVERVEGATDDATGTEGAISIQAQRDPRSHTATYLRAAAEIGIETVTPNGPRHDGVSQAMVTQRRGARFSAVDGYLKVARSRKNLVVRTGAHTTRVLLDGNRATGVEYSSKGKLYVAKANKEVILSGGAVNTPQLLMLSGIGERAELERAGIGVLVDSPEVGKNLRDHLVAAITIDVREDTLFAAESPAQLITYLLRRRGMLTSNVAEAYGFVKSDPALALPDIELLFAPVAFVGEGLVPIPEHGLSVGAVLLAPESHGTITLASSNPFDAPLIDPRYLSDPEGKDRAAMMAGLNVCEDIVATEAMGSVSRRHFIAPENSDSMTREQRDTLTLTRLAHTLYHPVGTARMGLDPGSVVDEALRVRGVQGLRVADASIMPTIIHGHTNAPAYVIGEKAADLIASEW